MDKPGQNDFFSKDELKFLKELVKLKADFMIVGLSAATLQGAPVVTQDIDLWFKELPNDKLNKALKKVGASYIPPLISNPPLLVGDAVKLFDLVVNMSGLESFDKERQNVICVDLEGQSIPVLKLDRIIHSKTMAGRDKDKLVLPVLEDTLKVIRKKGS